MSLSASRHSFDDLREAHLAALTGSLVDGIARGPKGAGYAWSRSVPDPTLNFAFGIRTPEQFAWAGATALGRNRAPAFLARDSDERSALHGLFEPAAAYPASWMTARTARVAAGPEDDAVSVHAGPVPPAGFESVFSNLSDDPAVKAHLRRHYLPAFRAARARPGIVPVHIVLSDADGPAACASLLLRGAVAGLYNVGTRADRQRRGLGARITAAALRLAGRRGAAEVFLQCPSGGAVEALYVRTGFDVVYAPTLLCTSRP